MPRKRKLPAIESGTPKKNCTPPKTIVNNPIIPTPRVGGVSLFHMYTFYAAVEKVIKQLHNILLITNKQMYINEYKYLGKYRLIIMYKHISTNKIHEYDHTIIIGEKVMSSFSNLKRNIDRILECTVQENDSPFATLLY